MMSWVLDHLPWWVLASIGAVLVMAVFVVMRSLGFTLRQTIAAMSTLGLSFLAATIYQKGRNAGARSAAERQRRDDARAVRSRAEIEDAIAGRTDDENRSRLKRWGGTRALLPLLVLMLLPLMLGACTTTGGSFCAAASPHRFSAATVDAMTDAEVRQEEAHNELGEKLCGWKP